MSKTPLPWENMLLTTTESLDNALDLKIPCQRAAQLAVYCSLDPKHIEKQGAKSMAKKSLITHSGGIFEGSVKFQKQ